MSSSFTKPASRARTASVTQHQDAKQEGRECKSTASDKPRCSKMTGHRSLASNISSKYTRQHTRSRASIRAQNVTPSIERTKSLSRVKQVARSTLKTKVNCLHHHAAALCKASEQTKSKRGRRHPRPPQSRPLALIGYNELTYSKINQVHQ